MMFQYTQKRDARWPSEVAFAFAAITVAGVVMVALFVMVIYNASRASHSPTLPLRKADWSCSASHKETAATMIMVGKTMVPRVTTRTVCIRYERTAK